MVSEASLRSNALTLIPALALCGALSAQSPISSAHARHLEHSYTIEQPAFVSTLYADGSSALLQSEIVWKEICGGLGAHLNADELQRMADSHECMVGSGTPIIVDTPKGADAGPNIVFTVSGSIPAGGLAALAMVETYIESQFNDAFNLNISLSFANLGPGVLGGTGSAYANVPWSTARAGLVNNKDANDTIQTSLPSGSTIPVRYTSGSSVTNENRVFFTTGAYKSTIGTFSGTDANMQFNSAFAFDYDPTNGISAGTYSFVDVAIHEVGHAMGCTSGIDFRYNDIEAIDIYRFQRTDGTGDYNPDTLAEFTARPRLAAYNAPNDAHNFDIISVEYRYADGSPYQASHFREQTPNIGIMDPAFAAVQTFYPNYYSAADHALFDAIGYDR
ncbi:MAG: hypothetical protein FJ299_10255 [Planctomycetes bacterium]|nr:hypothetical protein [Planctomycetota bacterium]